MQREARAKALESGGDVRVAVKAAVPKSPSEPVVRADGFDKRAWQREYMRTVYRPRKRKVREMVPGDIGLADWPR